MVGGENSIQRHTRLYLAAAAGVLAASYAWPLDGVFAASHNSSGGDSRCGIPLGISVVGGENSIQRHAGLYLAAAAGVLAASYAWPLDGVLAASHDSSGGDSRCGIPLGISVVGGENSTQRHAGLYLAANHKNNSVDK